MSQTYISKALRQKVAAEAKYRCGYCLTQERYTGMAMEIDHLIPKAKGGETVEENLWLACSQCNDSKNDRTFAPDPDTGQVVPLFNPRTQIWTAHFAWSEAGDLIVGLTPTGRATVVALNLNRSQLVEARQSWVSVRWHPPKD